MMRCIAIDDEKYVLDLLVDNIQKIPYLELVKTFKDALEASEMLQKERIDLIFLDIQMPYVDGLNFVRSLNDPPMVILVTAYQQYALEGYELNVIDYLLKPVSFERFLKACNNAHEQFILKNKSGYSREAGDFLFINVEYTSVKITVPDIVYIEALKDYVKIYLSTSLRPVLTKMSMKAMEEKLSEHSFLRVHKSYVVNISKIKSVERDMVYLEGKEIPIGDAFRARVNKMIK